MTNAFEVDPTKVDPSKNYLEELVGEGKKFKSVDELARGKAESDAYIQTLTSKLDELRDELTKRKTVEEVADLLRSRQDKVPSNHAHDDGDGEDEPVVPNSFKQEDIEALLEKKLQEKEAMSRAERNLNEVNEKLRNKFGDGASKVLMEKADQLGVSMEYLEAQAKANPKVFYRLIDLDRTTSSFTPHTPPSSSVNTVMSDGLGEGARTASYYEKLFKAQPHLRWDPKITIQQHKDAQRLKEKFFDT